MRLAAAQLVAEAAKDLGVEVTVYEDYSGRGMCGDKTTGLVYDSEGDFLQSIILASMNLKEIEDTLSEGEQTPTGITSEDFLCEFHAVRKDNMGLGVIAY